MPIPALYEGDCLDVLPTLDADSVDTCITDPPYGLSFMGKDWDHGVPGVRFWREVYRVLKPGAMLLAFGGTRTHHRLMVAIEDAGFEIRDCLMWLYGSGFPKSHDISKAIQKAQGTTPNEIVKADGVGFMNKASGRGGRAHKRQDGGWNETERRYIMPDPEGDALIWHGYGTTLKPAWEPIILAMKPVAGMFAENALEHGVAGLWIDGGRVTTNDVLVAGGALRTNSGDTRSGAALGMFQDGTKNTYKQHTQGRWPANLILDEQAGAMLDAQSGEQSRFFYCAKASRAERNAGLDGMEERERAGVNKMMGNDAGGNSMRTGAGNHRNNRLKNHHPTVKPLDLMRYLARLTKTPTGGVVLDPFMGSGTTGMAAVMEGRGFIGVELDADYLEIARRRIAWAQGEIGVMPDDVESLPEIPSLERIQLKLF